MTTIKVPTEVLLSVSEQFNRASTQLEMMNENLLRQIFMLMSNWYGQRGTLFETDFKSAYEQMNITIQRMKVISQELEGIAVRFMNADQLQEFMGEQRMELFAKLSTTSSSEPPKSFMDQVGHTLTGVANGLRTGLGSVVDSIIDTGTAFVKNPIGTIGDMAYNATVGTVEDVVGIAAWGKEMIMDQEEREAFLDGMQEQVNQSGTANFAGEQAGVMLGSLLVGRFGIKGGPNLKPETGGAGGSSKSSDEGTGNIQTGGRNNLSVDEYFRQEAEASKMYDSIRASTSDVQVISKNTGIAESRIQRIKDHVFNNEHIKSSGNGRFDPDYEIAQAWTRLQQGTYNKKDIDLLNHELFESRFEGIFKTNYETAHDAAVRSGRPWEID